jgi:hypothetical protein
MNVDFADSLRARDARIRIGKSGDVIDGNLKSRPIRRPGYTWEMRSSRIDPRKLFAIAAGFNRKSIRCLGVITDTAVFM